MVRLRRAIKGLIGVGVTLGLWEGARAVGVLPGEFAPSLGAIATAVVDSFRSGGLADAIGSTARTWAIAVALVGALGIPAGMLVGLSHWADAALRVLVGFLRPLPSVALIPVAILVAGLGLKMQLIVVVFAAFWPVFFNARHGVHSVEPLLIDTGKAAGLSRIAVVRRIVVPSALPSIFTGLRVSSAIALIVTIATELVTGGGGLGGFVSEARQAAQVTDTYAAIFVGGVLGFTVNTVFVAAETRLLSWNVGYRESAA